MSGRVGRKVPVLALALLGVFLAGAAVAGTGFEVCTVAADCQAGTAGGLGGEFSEPEGVAVDGAGNVYVADTQNNRIQKFDSSGNFLLAWGKDVDSSNPGTGAEICTVAANCQAAASSSGLGGEFQTIWGIGADGSGNVYVAETGGQRIQKFDSSGNFLRAWGKNVDLSNPSTGFEICTVAANCTSNSSGGLGGEMLDPQALAVDASGTVYVGDSNNQRIQKFDSSGNFLFTWGKDVDSSNPGTGFEICTVAANCQPGSPGGLGGEFNFIGGLASSGTSVAVADAANHRLQIFEPSGKFVAAGGKDVVSGGGTGFEICTVATNCQAGTPGGLGGELRGPAGVAFDALGNGYVADAGNQRIQKVDPAGNFLFAWGKDVVAESPGGSPPSSPTATSPTASGAAPLSSPKFAQTVNAYPVSGTVLIKLKGAEQFRALTAAEQVPVGSILDTAEGRVRLTSSKDRSGSQTETADFYRGVFRVLQPASGSPETVLDLVDDLRSQPGGSARLSRASSHRKSGHSNGLWGNGHGNYVTKGRNGSATVRGTIWFTQDRPNGTFFEAKKHSVLVHDFKTHRTILLHTGQQYLARR
jgi:sugar lactone lactonase YvrE